MKNLIKKCMRVLPDSWHISLMFFHAFKRLPDLKNPKTYSEKLQWLKLYYRKPECTVMVDKHLVKKYVADKIGEEYIIPTLGVWGKATDIDFDSLPNQFVLKWNHDSGSVIVCKDKATFDREGAIKKLAGGEAHNGFWYAREWPYKDVKPCIIAEQYLEDSKTEELRDYKFFCFGGEAKAMFIAGDRQKKGEEVKFDFFDMDFNHLPIRQGHPNAVCPPEKPERFEEMKKLAEKLSAGFPHLRVDFYEVEGKIYFGELTFFHFSGLMPFDPPEWDEKIGEWLTLPNQTE